MAVCVISNGENAALYCTSSDWAFGPVFGNDVLDLSETSDPEGRAERFIKWCREKKGCDVRELSDSDMQSAYSDWLEDISPNGGQPCQHPVVKITDRYPEDELIVLEGLCTTCEMPLVAETYAGEEQSGYTWEAA